MSWIRKTLQQLDWKLLAVLALFAALAPWPLGPEPHVVQKAGYLMAGTLTKPIDIFDLVFHLSPTLLLAAKLIASRKPSE